ncbi:MAG: acylphosphatase [Parachlamydiaceae bacterium]|nr:acylphosphatase [Parachlamydiaceae bacterium]
MQKPLPEMEIVEVHAIVKGHVQGVGFRATVSHYAKRLGLLGTVRNLVDGSVEIYAKGSRKSISQLFQALHQEFGTRHISNIDQKQITQQTHYEDFNILY